MPSNKKFAVAVGSLLTAVLLLAAGAMLCRLALGQLPVAGTQAQWDVAGTFSRELMGRISPMVASAIPEIRIHYTLSDGDLVAPQPDPAGYTRTQDPREAMAVVAQAEELLEGETTLFSADTPVKEGSTITCYRDETILALTWKQGVEGSCYTFAEVKVADASQFRRFFADGTYKSGHLYTTTEMSASVNAVVASAGDYYGYRPFGIVVNQGKVYRGKGHFLDTCYIDENGDLLFTYAREIEEAEEARPLWTSTMSALASPSAR